MESISAVFQTPSFSHVALALGAVLVPLVFWWRAGSIFTMLERVFRVAAGKSDITDPELKRFMCETRDLEKFRFIYKVKAETISEVHRLLTWMNTHKVGITDVRRAGRWIDLKSERIVSGPKKTYLLGNTIIAAVCYVAMFGLVVGASNKHALLQMKESKIWFLSDAKTVRPIFGGPKVDAVQCSAAPAEVQRAFRFTSDEAAAACAALASPEESLSVLVEQQVSSQRWLLLTIAGGFLVALMITIMNLATAAAAQTIERKIAISQTAPSCIPLRHSNVLMPSEDDASRP